jgi:hypothetical protein
MGLNVWGMKFLFSPAFGLDKPALASYSIRAIATQAFFSTGGGVFSPRGIPGFIISLRVQFFRLLFSGG